MGTRGVAVTKTALAKARERRRQLDRQRDAQDQRIEEATARTLVALDVLGEADDVRSAALVAVAEAMRELLAEDISPERAAALLEIDAAEVRRMAKVTAAEAPGGTPRVASGPHDTPLTGEAGPARQEYATAASPLSA